MLVGKTAEVTSTYPTKEGSSNGSW